MRVQIPLLAVLVFFYLRVLSEWRRVIFYSYLRDAAKQHPKYPEERFSLYTSNENFLPGSYTF